MPESVQSKAEDSAVEDESSYVAKLVDVPETVGDADLRSSSLETPATSAVTATPVYKGMTFKGMLMMAVCCGAPILLLAAVALFGVSLAGAGSALMSVALVLACPVGMYLMMRMMMKNNSGK